MVTLFRVGTNHPTERLNLHGSSVSPLPKSYRDAFSAPNWQNAMHGTLSHYKARLVAKISTRLEGVDVDETFSPVVKLGLFLSQKKYAVEILDMAHIVDFNPSRTLIDTESKLGSDGDPVHDPDSISESCKFSTVSYLYSIGYFICRSADLVAYSDADWAGCPTTRRPTSGYCVFSWQQLTLLVL
nr:ribonuclease H-like domain-containing protein [Tanacetum cinerariifolium]